jgi:hypothetical protein
VIRRDFIKTFTLAGSLAALPLLGSPGKAGAAALPGSFSDSRPGKINYDFKT